MMTDTILSKDQIEDFFQNLTLQILGVDPNSPSSQSRVRIEWPKNGYPGWKIDEDIAFLLVTYDDDAITRQMDVNYAPLDEYQANHLLSYTRVVRVSWTCYGPNSFNDIDTIRSSLYIPKYKELIKANNLALILDVPNPMRSPELFNGQWWDRSSFYARFNEKVTRTSAVPYITGSDVQVVKG